MISVTKKKHGEVSIPRSREIPTHHSKEIAARAWGENEPAVEFTLLNELACLLVGRFSVAPSTSDTATWESRGRIIWQLPASKDLINVFFASSLWGLLKLVGVRQDI